MYFEPASTPDAPAPPASDAPVDPFAGVPAELQGALRARGFDRLTPVQEALATADDGERDLRISSHTGSGKTVALGFALCRGLVDAARRGPTTLIVVPTRELAAQVCEELSWLFADLAGVACDVVTGGTNLQRERMRLRKRPAVLVGTPGRLLDHLREGALDLASVRQLVLDEADQMLDLGFKDELDGILAALPAQRRTHLVSATFPRAVQELADRFQRDALLIKGHAHGQAHADIEHVALRIHAREHYGALVNLLLLAGDERTLVFVRTREDTTTLADKLAADGFTALPLNGDLAQPQRTRTLAAFRNGTIRALIATDVAARGLDIQDVTMVVHVDLPIDAATYTHRSGRTGRAGQKGRSVMLVLKSHEGRSRRIYAQAKVTPNWVFPPGQNAVAARRLQRAEQHAATAISGHVVGEAERAVAAHLLKGRDPEEVVGALLMQAAAGPRAAFVFPEAPAPAQARAAAPITAPRATPAASPDAAPEAAPEAAALPPPTAAQEEPQRKPLGTGKRGRAGAPPAWRREAVREPGFVKFRINWGKRDGADARRILAHVCRRGDIDSKLVGAIQLHFADSTFDVADSVAAAFARSVVRRDRRDPHLVITRAYDRSRPPARGSAAAADEGAAE